MLPGADGCLSSNDLGRQHSSLSKLLHPDLFNISSFNIEMKCAGSCEQTVFGQVSGFFAFAFKPYYFLITTLCQYNPGLMLLIPARRNGTPEGHFLFHLSSFPFSNLLYL